MILWIAVFVCIVQELNNPPARESDQVGIFPVKGSKDVQRLNKILAAHKRYKGIPSNELQRFSYKTYIKFYNFESTICVAIHNHVSNTSMLRNIFFSQFWCGVLTIVVCISECYQLARLMQWLCCCWYISKCRRSKALQAFYWLILWDTVVCVTGIQLKKGKRRRTFSETELVNSKKTTKKRKRLWSQCKATYFMFGIGFY